MTMRVLHVITSLSTGGAEIMLKKLVCGLDPLHYVTTVVSLTETSTIGCDLKARGVPVVGLGGRGGILLLHQLWNLARIYRNVQPDIVHSWMYHANVAAQMLTRLAPQTARPGVIASVRGALHAPEEQKLLSKLVRRMDARLSRTADAIVFNSRRSAAQHAALGYNERSMAIIPNCFDTNAFQPMATARARIRAELGIGDDVLVGLVARFHRVKGHRTFLDAARLVANRYPRCRFLLVGRGCDKANDELARWISERALGDRMHTLGERRDIAAINNALDVAVCSSISESFPNAIGEAMACGIPSIVTDVGDCSYLVGDAGYVVPPRNAEALANAILTVASLQADARMELGRRGRMRVIAEFSVKRVVGEYTELYERCRARTPAATVAPRR